jgi:hypothetical protein
MTSALAALVVGILAAASVPASAQEVDETLQLPLQVSLSASSADCTNNPGPHVTLSGLVAMGGVSVDLIFRNNVKGTHEREVESTSSVELTFDDSITIPKQPVQGGTGGNPFIWVQFEDANGNAVSGEIYLGRCVQGLDASADADLSVPIALALQVASDHDSCTNNPGPWITLSGKIAVSGLDARVIFRNNDNKVGGPHVNVQESSATVEVVPDGLTVQIEKQPVLGGVGGNPRVYIAAATGDESTGEIYLGRCNQDL